MIATTTIKGNTQTNLDPVLVSPLRLCTLLSNDLFCPYLIGGPLGARLARRGGADESGGPIDGSIMRYFLTRVHLEPNGNSNNSHVD